MVRLNLFPQKRLPCGKNPESLQVAEGPAAFSGGLEVIPVFLQ